MKKIFFLTGILLLSAACINNSESMSEGSNSGTDQALKEKLVGYAESEIIEGGLLVKIDDRTAEMMEKGDSAEAAALLFKGNTSVTSFTPALSVRPANMKVAKEIGLDRWYMVGFDSDMPARKIASQLASCPQIKSIQYNSVMERIDDGETSPYEPAVMTRAATAAEDLPFDDPLLPDQWNLINNGDSRFGANARAGADINVKDAWKLTGGDPQIIVAVFDEGVNYLNPDLKNAMWINEAEKNGTPGTDDDNNGYIDDTYGYNFFDKKAVITWKLEHGTHVAGTVAATNNNGVGVSSVAGGTGNGDGVRIMSCQLFSNGTKTDNKTVADAFIYAADNGASIAQCSYGINGGVATSDREFVEGIGSGANITLMGAPFEYDAIQYFIHPDNANCKAAGRNLAIFAAGNNSSLYSSYPGALPFCISVTGFGPDFLPGGYSNYGPGCNIAAPGGDKLLYNNDPEPCMILSTGDASQKNKYVYLHGTSMACPHVSGVAALGMSYAIKIGKSFTGDEFQNLLLTSVQSMDQFNNGGTKVYLGSPFELERYKGKTGTGAIDAYRFLMAIEGTPAEIVKTTEKQIIDLKKYFGDGAEGLTYLGVECLDGASASLGLDSEPAVRNGVLEITCGKIGSGKLKIKAIAGGDNLGGWDATGGTEIYREISILARPFASSNGGWF